MAGPWRGLRDGEREREGEMGGEREGSGGANGLFYLSGEIPVILNTVSQGILSFNLYDCQ